MLEKEEDNMIDSGIFLQNGYKHYNDNPAGTCIKYPNHIIFVRYLIMSILITDKEELYWKKDFESEIPNYQHIIDKKYNGKVKVVEYIADVSNELLGKKPYTKNREEEGSEDIDPFAGEEMFTEAEIKPYIEVLPNIRTSGIPYDSSSKEILHIPEEEENVYPLKIDGFDEAFTIFIDEFYGLDLKPKGKKSYYYWEKSSEENFTEEEINALIKIQWGIDVDAHYLYDKKDINPFEGEDMFTESKESGEDYLKAQTASGLQIGDWVTVTHKAKSHEKGWGTFWSDYMDNAVGQTTKISGLALGKYNGFYLSNFPGYIFPYFVLKPLKSPEIKETEPEEEVDPFAREDMFTEAEGKPRDWIDAMRRIDQERRGELPPEEDEDTIPDEFMFESKIIFISNLEEIPDAIGDRTLAIQLNYDKEQALQLIEQKLEQLVPEYPDLTIDDKKEILKFMRKYKHHAKALSFRTFVHLAAIYKSNDPNREKWMLLQMKGMD
jgi:hypothetical protein